MSDVLKITRLVTKSGRYPTAFDARVFPTLVRMDAATLTRWCDSFGVDTIEITDGEKVAIGRGTRANYATLDASQVHGTAKTQTHEEWIASLKPGDVVEWRRGERDFDSPDGAWARGAYVGSTDTYRHVVSGWFVSPENIRPVQRDAKPVYVPVDLRVDTPTRFAAPAPASSWSFVSDGSSWHPIPAREAGTDHPKHEHVYGGDGYVAARMLGKTVALYVDGRVAVDGEMFASTNYIAAKDAEAIAKRDAIIAELTERVRVLTPVERKPERGAGLLTMRPMTRVGG